MQEIAGALAYDQRDRVFDRLNVWEREGAQLARQADAIALLRLGRMSEPALADAEARFPNNEGITALVREQRKRTAKARAAVSR